MFYSLPLKKQNPPLKKTSQLSYKNVSPKVYKNNQGILPPLLPVMTYPCFEILINKYICLNVYFGNFSYPDVWKINMYQIKNTQKPHFIQFLKNFPYTMKKKINEIKDFFIKKKEIKMKWTILIFVIYLNIFGNFYIV